MANVAWAPDTHVEDNDGVLVVDFNQNGDLWEVNQQMIKINNIFKISRWY